MNGVLSCIVMHSAATDIAGLLRTYVTSLSGNTKVVATALLNQQLFVTRDSVAQVSVYNKISLSLLRQITVSGFGTQLYGLATSAANNYLYVSDATNNKVHVIDLSVTSSVSVLAWSVPGWPFGLSLTSIGNVIVSSKYINNCVREYTPNGSLVRTITYTGGAFLAMELSNGLWAILSMSSLCTVLTNGTVTKCFRPGTTPTSFLRFFTIDTNGYYLVVDYNNNMLLMVDPSLTDAHQLQLPVNPALRSPISLSLDQSLGRLYIGEWDGVQNRVMEFDGIW